MSASATANGRPQTAPFLRRVRVRNFMSLADCDVELGPLTILVGRNGAGKSNFLEALNFVAEAMQAPLAETAGGHGLMWRKGMANSDVIAFELELGLSGDQSASYGFEIERATTGRIEILSERLLIRDSNDKTIASYHLENGEFADWSEGLKPPVTRDRLYLGAAGGLPAFRPVWDFLRMMRFYNFIPGPMKWYASAYAGEALDAVGKNLTSLIRRIEADDPGLKEWIKIWLSVIVAGVLDVNFFPLGPTGSLKFSQTVSKPNPPAEFYSNEMSDGTLRVLGILTAVAQLRMESPSTRLVGIEEPESALHPSASAAMMEALQESALDGQVIVTTHSPDLLDQVDLESDRLLVVEMRDGETVVGPIDVGSRSIVKKHLCGAGELLRQNLIELDRAYFKHHRPVPITESVPVPE